MCPFCKLFLECFLHTSFSQSMETPTNKSPIGIFIIVKFNVACMRTIVILIDIATFYFSDILPKITFIVNMVEVHIRSNENQT